MSRATQKTCSSLSRERLARNQYFWSSMGSWYSIWTVSLLSSALWIAAWKGSWVSRGRISSIRRPEEARRVRGCDTNVTRVFVHHEHHILHGREQSPQVSFRLGKRLTSLKMFDRGGHLGGKD